MKKFTIGLLLFFVIFTGAFYAVMKFPPWRLPEAVKVATGLGAKLACSNRYVSNFDTLRIEDDLASYSPVTRLLEFEYNDEEKWVIATLKGLNATEASYREGLGCSLPFGDASQIANVKLPTINLPQENLELTWPLTNRVDSIDERWQKKAEEVLNADNEDGLDSRAILIVKNGEIVAESYASDFDHTTKFLGWSMGKSVTAIMIGNLIYQDKLALRDINLFEQWADDLRSNISVEDLLTMTSGLAFDETYQPGTDSTKMLFTAPSASDVALSSEYGYEPGTHFSYSSGTSNILSRIIYEKVGANAQANIDYFYTSIVRPLSLYDTVFETDAKGVFVGSSYIYASARDWAKLGQLMLNKGELNGNRILSEEYVEKASQANTSENDSAYGYQFWLNSDAQSQINWQNIPSDAYAMRGNRAQIVLIIPSKNMLIVRLGWSSSPYDINTRFKPFLAANIN